MNAMITGTCRTCGRPGRLIDVFGDMRCPDCWHVPKAPTFDFSRLRESAQALEPTSAPWKLDRAQNVGENWLVAELGQNSAGTGIILTTDRIRASECHTGEPDEDGAWMVWCRNHWDAILAALAIAAGEEAV